MTSPVPQNAESAEITRKKRSLLITIASWALVGALLGGAVAFLVMQAKGDEDDDRPPIIVRNGSVRVEVATPGDDGFRGKLVRPTLPGPGKKTWYHDFGTGQGKSPTKMAVAIAGVDPGVSGSCSSSNFFFAQRVSKFTISYSYVDNQDGKEIPVSRALDLYLDSGRVQFDVDAAAGVKQPDDATVEFDASATMKSVQVWFKKKPKDKADADMTCTFGGSVPPQITVFQRK
jgi:hypothetical protein